MNAEMDWGKRRINERHSYMNDSQGLRSKTGPACCACGKLAITTGLAAIAQLARNGSQDAGRLSDLSSLTECMVRKREMK